MRKIEYIVKLLVREYGNHSPDNSDPLETLIQAILSQNTTDKNSSRAYSNLINTFKIKDLAQVNTKKLAKVIHSGGLPLIKAKRIKRAVKFWQENNLGRRIKKMSDEQVRKTLVKIDGVGPKSAEIVIVFGLGRQGLPVDTHVYRVSKRLGLVAAKKSREKAAEILRKKVPQKLWSNFHVGLVLHGREVCKSQKPKCKECLLLKYCPYGKGL